MNKTVPFVLGCLWLLVVFAGCKTEKRYNLGNYYYLEIDKENPANTKLVHSKEDGFEDVILGEIIDYNSDPSYIIIHRKVTEKARAIFEDNPLWQQQLKGSDQYWIIDKKEGGLTGPLDMAAYLAKRKELQISNGVMVR
ncbi:hypothetical protein [Parasediminibacterium sp. JCM 36343]|uniref:hypothetical protein n=1 Tax=Parasediminibacterium sp. JCM 36343 TaxID=3374279 RepID=UPI00397B049C